MNILKEVIDVAYKTLRMDEIKKVYDNYLSTRIIDVSHLDQNYKDLRDACVAKYYSLKELSKNRNGKSSKHFIDMYFGFFLYDYLNKKKDFVPKYESDYDFWRYIAVCVIPDIVSDRWDITKSDHFYTKPTGIYPFQVYWYIKLSWQGSKEKTIDVLKDNQEDQILQLVDRPSSIGINLNLYRRIMFKLSTISIEERQKKFRAVMMKNTAKLVNVRPELYEGGIEAYVDMLYQ